MAADGSSDNGARAAAWRASLRLGMRELSIRIAAFVHHPFSERRRKQRRWRLRLERAAARGEQVEENPTTWFRNFRPGSSLLQALSAQAAAFDGPRISVVVPVVDADNERLRFAIESVRRQLYANWELICVLAATTKANQKSLLEEFARTDRRIRTVSSTAGVPAACSRASAESGGDLIVLMYDGDVLEPHALFRFAMAAAETGADLLYADDAVTSADHLDDIVRINVRPAFSYDGYLSRPYAMHPVAIRRSIAAKAGFGTDMVAQDIDFLLRVIEQADIVAHIPDVLCRRSGARERPSAEQAEAAVRAHLIRSGYDPTVGPGAAPDTLAVRFAGNGANNARVAIIIPTRNRLDLLSRCVASLKATIADVAFDIVIVDHQSDDPETIAYLTRLAADNAAGVVPYAGAFNFSKINNHAVSSLGRAYDFYLFLNNDVEAIEPGWLDAMVDVGSRRDVGIVGATLVYPDRTIQHCGVVVGMFGAADHAFKFVPLGRAGRSRSAFDCSPFSVRDCSAVTAACLLIRAEVFRAAGGFDEGLAVGFGDTDLCLRVRRLGYAVLNHGGAVLIHAESASRGAAKTDPHPEDTSAFRARYADLLAGDPFYSPLLLTDRCECRLDPEAICQAIVAARTVRRPAQGRAVLRFDQKERQP